MSRQRNNFITDRNLLPSDINYITNLNKELFNQNIKNKVDSDNKDKLFSNNKLDRNVVFFKKPKFLRTSKEYSNKDNHIVIFYID